MMVKGFLISHLLAVFLQRMHIYSPKPCSVKEQPCLMS